MTSLLTMRCLEFGRMDADSDARRLAIAPRLDFVRSKSKPGAEREDRAARASGLRPRLEIPRSSR